ncbi:MAG TPA: hypothetical protein ENL03_03385, partial [Phycisphaerae bacterium]|nr:hypothetical protein [Phycisphaerae bacterium]
MREMMPDSIETPKVIKIADGFYVRQEIDNIAWIDLGGYTLIIDTLEHVEKASAVLAAMAESIGDTSIRYIL